MQRPATAAPRARRRTAALHAVVPGVAARVLMGLVLAALLTVAPAVQAQFWSSPKTPLPEFVNQSPAAWINSKPLTKADLKGKVVLIEIWTSI